MPDRLRDSRRGDTAGVRRALHALDGDPRLAQRGGLLFLVGEKDSAYAMRHLYPFRQEPRYQAILARMGMPERLRR